MTPRIQWYFDFISPFAYLQFVAHPDLFARPDVALRPVVFAGLLEHWGHKGPAEIPAKRVQTFRQLVWACERRGVRFRMPPAHPFNPVPVLRLALALGATQPVVGTIYEFIWAQGRSVDTEWDALCDALGAADAAARIGSPAVKDALRANGRAAIAAGVFGVPSFVLDGEVFWGEDATPMLRDYLADPRLFDHPEMRRVLAMPAAANRIQHVHPPHTP